MTSLQDVRELYPELSEDEYFYGPSDYSPLLASLGPIAVRVDRCDYQGDSWVLFDYGAEVGFLRFGWGSCSGCDSLQACSSYRDIDELRDSLAQSVRKSSRDEMAAYLRTIDPSVSWNPDDERRFLEEALAYLAAESDPARTGGSL